MSTSLQRAAFPRAGAIGASREPRVRTAGAPVFRAVLHTLYVVSGAAVLWLLLLGSSFYLTPVGERAHHEGYWEWKAGGSVGHAMGSIGASMLVLMLLYSARKRVKALRGLGPVSRWLDVHIYLGVFGPLLVVLHSAFKVQGLVALSFWSMIAVALSGVAGRYLYLQIPRTRAGEELSLADLTETDRRLTQRLRQEFGLDAARLERLESLAAAPEARRGLLGSLADLLLHRARQLRAVQGFARSCRTVPAPVLQEFEQVLLQKAALRRRILLWDRLHELFHYWNVIHKPFAVVMYLFMLIHIAVAVLTGYGWAGGS